MNDTPIHIFPDRGPGEWVAYADYAALLTRAETAEAAIDSIETSHGLTDNGNLWRFWSEKSREVAGTNTRLRAERDALQAENDRLIDLCRAAYLEGYGHGQIDAGMTTRGKTNSSIQDDAARSWDGFSYARTLIANPTPPTP